MKEAPWTLDELAELVDAALAVDYDGQPSGRVREVPDRRVIRWYTTIGLVDRPTTHRGRTALYGPRHLLQLVAVKRLQARGLPLVAIQQELAGATDTQLARVARLSAVTASGGAATASDGIETPGEPRPPRRPRTAVARTVPTRGSARRDAFWRERPSAPILTAGATPEAAEGTAAEPEAPTPPGTTGPDGLATLRGVRIGEGATLLLEPGRELEAADLRAILDAARPLLATLRSQGLAGTPGTSGTSGTPRGPGASGDPEAWTGGHEPRREHP